MARPGWRRLGERAGTDPLYESGAHGRSRIVTRRLGYPRRAHVGTLVRCARLSVTGAAYRIRHRPHRVDAQAWHFGSTQALRGTAVGVFPLARNQRHWLSRRSSRYWSSSQRGFRRTSTRLPIPPTRPTCASGVVFPVALRVVEVLPCALRAAGDHRDSWPCGWFLFALPFLDRGPSRNPFSRGRAVLTLVMLAIGAGTVFLTMKGLADSPGRYDRTTGARGQLRGINAWPHLATRV